MTNILGTTLEENLSMIYDTISYLKDKSKTVFFDAEHFFDGYKNNRHYAMEAIRTAEKAGAECLILCDTNGGCFPDDIKNAVEFVGENSNVDIGIHCHNDCGLAVANTLAAIDAGATQIQGTFIGFGERCGDRKSVV